MAREKLVGDTTQRILITFSRRHATKLFRCHISQRAKTASVFSGCFQHRCDTEVCKNRFAFRIKENVLRLEITMNDVIPVSVLECSPDLCENSERLLQRKQSYSLAL